MKETYPEYFHKNVNINSVLHNRNNIRSVREFIEKEFGKTPIISEINAFGICENKMNEFNKIYHPIPLTFQLMMTISKNIILICKDYFVL